MCNFLYVLLHWAFGDYPFLLIRYNRFIMRKLVYAFVILLAVIFVIAQFTEVRSIMDTLQRGDWLFIFLAIGMQLLWIVNVALSYQVLFRATGIREKLSKLVLLSAAANFLNVVAPSVGMSGMSVFIAEAKRQGYSSGRVTVGGVSYWLFDYAGFLFVLALGLVVLFQDGILNGAEIVATLLLLLQATFLASMLYLGMRSSQALGDFLAGCARAVNRLLHPVLRRQVLLEERAYSFAHEASAGLHQLRHNMRNLGFPLLLGLSNKLILLAIFSFMFQAFQVPATWSKLVAGFSVMYLFFIMSITPSGIGVVEGVLTLVLTSMRVSMSDAVVVTLAYRGITLWLPLLYGFLAFRYLSRRPESLEAVQA